MGHRVTQRVHGDSQRNSQAKLPFSKLESGLGLPAGKGRGEANSPSSLKGWPKAGVVVLVFLFSTQVFAQIDLIPKPKQIARSSLKFKINSETRIYFDSRVEFAARFLQTQIKKDLGFDLKLEGSLVQGSNVSNSIIIGLSSMLQGSEESYYIEFLDPRWITIYGKSMMGIYRALSTLRQSYLMSYKKGAFSVSTTIDSPTFPHRGLLLDCSRHFFSVETVKKYIDLLAFYKMNVLHWHLTEDQGWRIQIDKYPKLTEVGAWRTEKDGSRYGGFYTKEEIREVVAYATARGVTVIPEIEMPGHSQAALATYPHLSCTGDTGIKVANDWGVFKEIYCAGNDSVFTFLEDVLTEVMELFPSKYIHIGGDEAPKYRWEHCPKCQMRMADEGLKVEHELQSYFITRIEKFLNQNGRQLIGWDEILEGGLSPNATVQSWRGMEHGKHAAEMKHNVVMSPTSHCYLDYGLDAIDLERVYSFNPIPEGMEAEFEQYILGGEVNMWTEHVPNDSVLDSKVFPRLIAMAEVLWSGPGGDYGDFYNRLQAHYPILEKMGVKYGLEADPVSVTTFVEDGKTFVKIEPGLPNLTIEYSPGDDLAHPYQKPFALEKSINLEVMAYKNGQLYGDVYEIELVHHLALGKTDSISTFSPYYTAGGKNGLTDGLIGSLNFRDGRWMGFSGTDAVIEIDLGKKQVISAVTINFYEYPNAWIMLPSSVSIAVSADGETWNEFPGNLLDGNPQNHPSEKQIVHAAIEIGTDTPIRFIKVHATNYGKLPSWHEAAGSDAWIFVDEIIVN